MTKSSMARGYGGAMTEEGVSRDGQADMSHTTKSLADIKHPDTTPYTELDPKNDTNVQTSPK